MDAFQEMTNAMPDLDSDEKLVIKNEIQAGSSMTLMIFRFYLQSQEYSFFLRRLKNVAMTKQSLHQLRNQDYSDRSPIQANEDTFRNKRKSNDAYSSPQKAEFSIPSVNDRSFDALGTFTTPPVNKQASPGLKMLQSDYMAERDTSVAKNAGGRNYFDSQSKTQGVDYNRKYQQENYGNKNLSGNRKNILAQKDTFSLKERKCMNEGGPQEFSGKGTVDMNYFLNCLQDLDINVDNLRPQ